MNEAIRRYGLPSPVIDAARAELEAAAKRRFEVGKTHLYRIASAACDRRFGSARTTEVKARYVSRKVPPFGARDSVPFLEETNTYDFPWALTRSLMTSAPRRSCRFVLPRAHGHEARRMG
jgi:hypothetical protein